MLCFYGLVAFLKPKELLLCRVVHFHTTDVYFCSPKGSANFTALSFISPLQNSVMEKVFISSQMWFVYTTICRTFFSGFTCKQCGQAQKLNNVYTAHGWWFGLRQLNPRRNDWSRHTYNAAGAVGVRALSKVYFDRIKSTLNADPDPTRPPGKM